MLTLYFSTESMGDDFAEVTKALGTDELRAAIAMELTRSFGERIERKIDKQLFSTKEPYKKALNIDIQNAVVELDTDDFLISMVEHGVDPFDMKPGLLNGPNVRIGKNGQKFAIIPISKFRKGKYNWRDRSTGRYAKGSNSGPVEFRIVSEKSDPQSFQHPGFKGYEFMEETFEELQDDADIVMSRYFS